MRRGAQAKPARLLGSQFETPPSKMGTKVGFVALVRVVILPSENFHCQYRDVI